MAEMTTTMTETVRGRHGVVYTWAEIVDGVFVRGSLNIKIDRGNDFLFIRNLSHLLDVIAAAHELRVAIAEKVTDAS